MEVLQRIEKGVIDSICSLVLTQTLPNGTGRVVK